MNPPRILVAGIGNIFLGDDAFGVEVAQRLLRRPLACQARVVDFGIRGLDLTYELLEDYDAVILIDACPRGEPPGTLQVIEPDTTTLTGSPPTDLLIQGHSMDPVRVLLTAASMGARLRNVLLVGCQPQSFGSDEDPQMELSPPVRAAVNEAVSIVEQLAAKFLSGGDRGTPVAAGLSENPLSQEAS